MKQLAEKTFLLDPPAAKNKTLLAAFSETEKNYCHKSCQCRKLQQKIRKSKILNWRF